MLSSRARRSLPSLAIALVGALVWGSMSAGSGRVIAGQGQKPTVSSDLTIHPRGPHTHRIVVQAPERALGLLRRGSLGLLRRDLKAGAVALEVNDAQLAALQANPALTNISGDLLVTGHMAVTNRVTHATDVWEGLPNLLGLPGMPGYTGSGVGVAILDSGIARHTALDDRVVAHVDMVSDEKAGMGDPFGHGTHIAGIVAGNRTAAAPVTPAFAGGSAPSTWLVDVRVLGANGAGRTSDVIAGIDWVIDHRTSYNVRVINLSLGHAVTEPSATDPLCRAVLRAVIAGITVVVSAGNYGQTSAGDPVLGGITSPGNSPAALTVGAIDTRGTLDTSDDVVAPFSSRGPTPYEMAVKPDVVAPGVRIVSLEALNSYVSATYPQWHIAGKARNAYLRMSGTSMATAVVTGGVALLLNAEPSLSPAQVKMAMQMGARFMPDAGLVGAGTGSVNFAQSLEIVRRGLSTTGTTSLAALLGTSSGAALRDPGTPIDRIYESDGIRLLRPSDLGEFLRSGDRTESGVLTLLGLSNPLGSAASNYIVWGNVSGWSGSYYIVWGNTIMTPTGQYIVWGNGSFTDASAGSYIVWGNSLGGVR